jgi:hypothetical protein
MKTYLHIHHLDPGEEENIVLSCLRSDGIIPNYSVEGKTSDGNSVRVYIGNFDSGNIEKQILELLEALSNETLEKFKAIDLSISLRLVVKGICAYFSPKILNLAGSKGVEIYVFNGNSV